MTVQQIKQRFGIIGNAGELNRAIEIAIQVAPTDMSVLITGESGTGKDIFPKIIHSLGARKHSNYIAVNCGAIPEGTIDSELFGHEKGSFTGASAQRKGYFETSDGGTIFLDEIGELPITTQAKLLRVLETGEYIRVGSSQVKKTNVRIIAATNINIPEAIKKGKFREDLYYRLNTVPINIPALRHRKADIHLLFRKFAQDFSEKYRMPPVKLTENAVKILESYQWSGNVRQIKNITEQISIIEEQRLINSEKLQFYLPNSDITQLPAIYNNAVNKEEFSSEREILYKILFDMRNEINELKSFVKNIAQNKPVKTSDDFSFENSSFNDLNKDIFEAEQNKIQPEIKYADRERFESKNKEIEDTEEIIEESLSLKDKEIELITKALAKYKGKRKYAAQELGISERTLYRKIKEYNIL